MKDGKRISSLCAQCAPVEKWLHFAALLIQWQYFHSWWHNNATNTHTRSIWKNNSNNNKNNKNWATESKSNRWKEKSSSENWHIDGETTSDCVRVILWFRGCSGSGSGGGDNDLLVYQTYNFLARTTIIFNHPCCLYPWNRSDVPLVAQLEINVFCFEVRNGMKKKGMWIVLETCCIATMLKEAHAKKNKNEIKLNNFCSVNEHMIGITVAGLVCARARQNPIPMAKQR